MSKWETGEQTPDPEALERLASALNVRVSYFLSPSYNSEAAPRHFRSMATATATLRKKCGARLSWLQEVSLTLQQWVDFPQVNIPQISLPHFSKITEDDIEAAAEECRRHWRLGTGPISDMLLVLENAGVVVAFDEMETDKLDGVSEWAEPEGRPYVLLASDKNTCVRSRFDAAHELGHLVLHRGVTEMEIRNLSLHKELERQAHRFASAFLMPAERFSIEVQRFSLDALLAMKSRWRTAVGAMIMRCRDLDLISDEYASQLFKYRSARRWTKQEPLDDVWERERPRLLSRSLRLILEEGGVALDALAEELSLSPADVEALCDLPSGFMTDRGGNVVVMPTLKSSVPDAERPSDGKVVNFPGTKR